MTRETKIGMLVGLGVIVLIGVLLSEYLGNGVSGPQAADLGQYKGEQYRAAVEHDVGVPSQQPIQPGTGEPTIARGDDDGVPVAFAQGQAQPILIRQPVTPMQDGVIPPDPRLDAAPPVLFGDGGNPVAPTVVIQAYTVQKNDTVKSLAKKFYNATGSAEIGRIILANPGVLKDANTMLVIGKKLNIPMEVRQPVVVHPPTPPAPPVIGPVTPPAPALPTTVKTYTIVKGDTLSTIAKKTLGTGGPIAVSELQKANGLKDGAILKEGAVLKIPVKTVAPGR